MPELQFSTWNLETCQHLGGGKVFSNGNLLIVTSWIVKDYNIQILYTKLIVLVIYMLNSCIITKHFFTVLIRTQRCQIMEMLIVEILLVHFFNALSAANFIHVYICFC